MLKEIRDMINRKSEFVESAAIIFEDVIDTPIDELIILEADDPIGDLTEDNLDMGDTSEPEPIADPMDDPVEEPEAPESSPAITDAMGEPEADLPPLATGTDDVPPASADLPEPVGAQTGEPTTNDDLSHIVSASVDLQSNTFSDILPVPPVGAAGAVVDDDILSARIDSGFEEEPAEEPEPAGDSGDILDQSVSMDPEAAMESKTYDAVYWHIGDNPSPAKLESAKEHFKAILGFAQINNLLTESALQMFQKPFTTDVTLKGHMFTPTGRKFMESSYEQYLRESDSLPTLAQKMNGLTQLWVENISLGGEPVPPAPVADPAPAAPPPPPAAAPPVAEAPPIEEPVPPPAVEEAPLEELPPDDPSMAIEEPAAEESEVTAAVKDKLAEAETDAAGSLSGTAREEVLDQLDKLNKEVLNAKEKVKKLLA